MLTRHESEQEGSDPPELRAPSPQLFSTKATTAVCPSVSSGNHVHLTLGGCPWPSEDGPYPRGSRPQDMAPREESTGLHINTGKPLGNTEPTHRSGSLRLISLAPRSLGPQKHFLQDPSSTPSPFRRESAFPGPTPRRWRDALCDGTTVCLCSNSSNNPNAFRAK